MASLQGNTIKDTYKSLLKVADNGELEAGLQEITDGDGNGTGVSLNTGGDVTATGTVAFGSIKDSGENITVTKFVDEADGISNNDNDTSIPTSAAVKDYVDTNITAQDLDITDGTNVGAVDLDSQLLTFTGAGTVSTVVSGQTLTITGAGTDLSNTPSANDVVVESSDGNNTTLGAATTSAAGVMTSADKSKLNGIETGAEVNPDASEVKSLYESNADTNAFTDAQLNKLNGIESGAEVNSTASEVKTLYESNADTNAFTDAEQTKLGNIESGAQVNTVDSVNTQTGAVVLDADDIDDATTTNKFTTQVEIDKLAGIESGAEVNTVDSVNGETGVVVLDADDISDTSTTNKFVTSTEITKLGNITVTQAVDLDTLESDVATNNAKISFDSTSSSKLAGIEENADVTDATNVAAAGAMMTGVAVLNDLSDVSGTPSDGQVLTYDTINGWQPETSASAPVTSVNSETGAVVLDADDISDATTTNKFTTQTDIDKLAGIETGAEVNTVDSVNTQTGAVVLDADDIDDSTTTNKFTNQTDIDKLSGIESGAEVNTVDSVNGETGVVVLDADNIDDTSTTHKFTTQTDIDKLGGIEALADVTDATNVAAAGAVMTDTAGSLSSLAVSGNLTVDTNTLFVDAANNNVGIRTSSPDAELHIGTNSGVAKSIRLEATGNQEHKIQFNSDGTNYGQIGGGKSGSGVGDLRFYTYSGALSEKVRILSSGGITFNGDTAAANALDDYEEGTWTMGIAFGGAAVSVAYDHNLGTYTKIGRQVTVNGYLDLGSKGSSTGNATITGLPFTIPNFTAHYSAVSIWTADVSFANQMIVNGGINTTSLFLEETTEAGTASALTNANISNTSRFIVSLTYFV